MKTAENRKQTYEKRKKERKERKVSYYTLCIPLSRELSTTQAIFPFYTMQEMIIEDIVVMGSKDPHQDYKAI